LSFTSLIVCRTYLPEFGADLIAALPALDVEDFSHGGVEILVRNPQRICFESLANALECKALGSKEEQYLCCGGTN